MSADMLVDARDAPCLLLHIRSAQSAFALAARSVLALFVLALTLAVFLRVDRVACNLLLLGTIMFAQSPMPGFNRPCWL